MDVYKKISGKVGQVCPYWSCFENDSRKNWIRKHARRIARHRLRQRDLREQNEIGY